MNSLHSLIIPIVLGIVGGGCNFIYLSQQAKKMETQSFVLIDDEAKINSGDVFKDSHFSSVNVPKNNLGNLDKVGVLWKDRTAVIGFPATRSYQGSELLLWQDVATPSQQQLSDRLAENEVARWVPVNSNTFVPDLVNPGDYVSFVIPPESSRDTNTAAKKGPTTKENIIGPFRILMMGTRTGQKNIRSAAGLSSGREHVITISVRYENGEMEPKATQLFNQLAKTGFKSVNVMLHSEKQQDSPAR